MIRICAALLLTLSVSAQPTPEQHFGHPMGADRKLLDWDKVVSYFHALEKSSRRIRVSNIGLTTEGRPLIAATIAAPETLAKLDRYREIQRRLADPRLTTPAEAEKFIADGKTVVLITCSIHSTEVQSTSTAVELAYRMASQDTPKLRAILQNTIFLLVPSLNPDGVDIVTRWYRKTLGTPYEGTSPPELYHKYVGHDNNRDWYIFSQAETRHVISRLHNVWRPQIVYDIHQQQSTASRMFVPPWLDPIDPNVDPIIAQMANAVGATMASDLTAAGKTGVSIHSSYDFWTPARHYQSYHGGLRILSESASARLATPVVIRAEELSESALGYNARERSWNHLEPWAGGEWRVRDIMEYQLIAMESCLYQAATRRQDLLRAFYRVGAKAVARTAPYAFVIPAGQFDPGSTRVMLETLHFGMVDIGRANRPFTAGGKQYAAGSYVILMQQPYSSWAKTLLERQQYPDVRLYPGGPPTRPYDVTAHTLPLLMGVTVDTIDAPFTADLTRATAFEGSRSLSAANIDSWQMVNAAWKQGQKVWRDPQGDFSLQEKPGARLLRQPRIGLYQSYEPSMDEGWTRWLLERFGFAYHSLRNPEVIAGNLRQKYDAIILPDMDPGRIYRGYRPGSMPPEFVGGVGQKGEEELKRFVASGGTLVCLNKSTAFAIGHLRAPATNVLEALNTREFYSPGSLLNVTLDTASPLALGLPREIAVWSEGSPAFQTAEPRARSVATYAASGILASGWLLGEKHLAGRSALLDIPVGSGRMILFGMRPQYRAQSYQTFKLFFNALVLAE